MQATRERELWSQPVTRSEHPCAELPSMPLHLITMFIDTSKEIRSSVDVQHDSSTFLPRLSRSVVSSHFDPFCFELRMFSTPLPPLFPTNVIDSFMTELGYDCVRSFREAFARNRDIVDFDPSRMWDPLGGESLELFHGMVGGIIEELTYEVKTFVIGDVCSRLLA